ncbi:MAG: hypothetical protein HQM08_03060 [Candidatus Riflebacteria bacterium]|nr:hypothetical protein [Candidatus Riflebacteria bacterium]
MLEKIETLVFYFTIDCAICHNKSKVSHVAIEEQNGQLVCTLCGKAIKVPNHERLVAISKELNDFLANRNNVKFITLTKNEAFNVVDDVPAAAH